MSRLVGSWSLRRRMLAIGLFGSSATLAAGGYAMYEAADIADQSMLDTRLATLAQTVLGFSEHEIEEIMLEGRAQDPIHIETRNTLGTRYVYQVWSPKGELLLRSYLASDREPMMPLPARGFGGAVLSGESHRTYAQEGNGGGMIIQVAERMSDRHSAIGLVSKYFLAFLAIPLILIGTISWWMLNRSLRSIDGYATQLRNRHPLDLNRLNDEDAPSELRPMLDSINELFGRVSKVLSVERGFTAVTAHEMRTPMAGLRAQVQLATLAETPQKMEAALRALKEGIDHANHLQEQLLDLARIDMLTSSGRQARTLVNLHEVYHHVISEIGPMASERDVTPKARFDVPSLHASELGLHLLMRNLLVNAVRYTPKGGRVEITSSQDERGVKLTVDDSGVGIPADQRVAAFERFNRLGRADSKGVGLGLSIVQSVAEAHDATVTLLESPIGGLRVEVRFPLSMVVMP